MPHFPFIAAAYGITIALLGGFLIWSLWRMRRAERAVEEKR